MLVNNSRSALIDVELKTAEFSFRFCNFFDSKSREFEEKKIRSQDSKQFFITDDDGDEKIMSWPPISYWQSYHYLDYQNAPYYFLQMSDLRTDSHYQISITTEVSKISLFQVGTIHKWIMDTENNSIINQKEFIQKLIFFCKRYTSLMSLRIQPYMPGEESLIKTHQLLSPLGFNSVLPKAYIKTRIIDLRPSVEDMLKSHSANGRARIKIKEKNQEDAFVKDVSKTKETSYLQKALNESYLRSANQLCPYDFSPLLKSSIDYSKEVVMLGFYLKEAVTNPKAFITGITHNDIVEFSIGGSVSDSKLRQFPFNHILMWQLILRSKENGAKFLDMGGISTGNQENQLSGINNFKRLFPGFELTIGHEMQNTLRPTLMSLYTFIQRLVSKIKQGMK